MKIQPAANSNHLTPLVSQDKRLRFILYFAAVTLLAGILSVYPIDLVQKLFTRLYPPDPVPPLLPVPVGLLDILSFKSSSYGVGSPINWLGVLHSVAIQTVSGILAGILQGTVLRPYLSRGGWILATIVGYQIAGLLANPFSSSAIYYALICQGLLQWLILRQLVRDAWIWLLTYPVSYVLLTLLDAVLASVLKQNSAPNLAVVISNGLLALIQAIVLGTFWLKRSQAT